MNEIRKFLQYCFFFTCFRHLQIPQLPAGLQIMADKGFQNQRPLLIPAGPRNQQIRGIMER